MLRLASDADVHGGPMQDGNAAAKCGTLYYGYARWVAGSFTGSGD